MLKKLLIALLTTGLLSVGSAAVAEPTQIGYVDAEMLLKESPQFQAVTKALESEFSRREQELLGKQKELKQLEDKLDRDSKIMSSSERNRLEKDILARRRTLKNEAAAFQEDLSLRQNEEFNKLRRKVLEVVAAVAKEQKIDVVLGVVVYASRRIDISDKVLERLRKDR
jgi:outer membrane protein